jgi:magnesium chelatase subunit H
MRERLAKLNPQASMRMANRLLEASDRAYWTPDAGDAGGVAERAADAIEDRHGGDTAAE